MGEEEGLFKDDQEKQELAIMYCGMILNEVKADITEENINKLLSASKVEVAPYWPKMFAEIVKGKDFDKIMEDSAGAPGLEVEVVVNKRRKRRRKRKRTMEDSILMMMNRFELVALLVLMQLELRTSVSSTNLLYQIK